MKEVGSMNREIKFRGFHKFNDYAYWCYGYYFSHKGAHSIYLPDGSGSRRVDPKSVGEYIGLKDKNEVEIYEGDIIKDWSGTREVKFEIFDNQQGFDIQTDDLDLEILGNIYEHPELITV